MRTLLLALAFVFIACSSKQYYEPVKTEKLSEIKIKKENILKNFKGYNIIKEEDGKVFISNSLGFLKILKDNEVIFNKQFSYQVVSICTDANTAVMLDAGNNVMVFDIYEQKYLFSQNYGNAYGVIKPIASPVITNSVILIPTLDGKLVVLSKANYSFLRTINVGTQDFFNNIIYFKAEDEFLIAASSSKLFTILNNKTYSKLLNIKNVAYDDDNIFVLSNDGRIIKYDLELNELKSNKFKYANFNAIYIYNSYIYALEHQGYLIKLNNNLKELSVFKLPDIKTKAYFKDNVLYYNNNTYELK